MAGSITTSGLYYEELQSLRHQLTDAVYESTDIDCLRSCLQSLKEAISSKNNESYTLPREQGEELVCETFLPAFKDALNSEKDGTEFPDVSELFVELEKEEE